MLFQMECPETLEDEFHDWYDNEHIPERMDVPGFFGATRYEVVGKGPRFLARYNMKDLSALDHPEYVKVKQSPSPRTEKILSSVSLFTRYVTVVFSARQRDDAPAKPEDIPYIMLAGFAVPKDAEKDFDDWYEEEHTDMLLQAKGWWRSVRLKVVSGEPETWTDIAIHEVASLETLNAPERIESRKTPWSQRIRSQPWFLGGQMVIYRKFADF
jgi:hypothetical protein